MGVLPGCVGRPSEASRPDGCLHADGTRCKSAGSLLSLVGRIGLVFVVSQDDDVDGMQDAGVALVRAYNYIREEADSQSAFEAVISVSPPSGEKKDFEDSHPIDFYFPSAPPTATWKSVCVCVAIRCSTRSLLEEL